MNDGAGTPLDRLLPHLSTGRAYWALRCGELPGTGWPNNPRREYTSVEQVAAASDGDLLNIRGIGPKALAEIRAGVQKALNLPPAPHRPERGSDVEAWIKGRRDELDGQAGGDITAMWMALDSLLDDYRLHADTGTPLDADVQGPHPEEG